LLRLLPRHLIQSPAKRLIMESMRNDRKRNHWYSRWRMRRIYKFVSGSALGY
jgi:hypothetical protein